MAKREKQKNVEPRDHGEPQPTEFKFGEPESPKETGHQTYEPPSNMTHAEAAKKLHEKIEQMEGPGTFTARGLGDMVLPRIEDFKNYYARSSEERRKRKEENEKQWREKANSIWANEANDIRKLSSREEVATKIADDIKQKDRAAIGTIENAIKGLKSKHLKTWRRNSSRK